MAIPPRPPYRATRVDAAGKVQGQPVPLAMAGDWGDVAIAGLGDRLVVAHFEALDPSAPSIAVSIYDDAGIVTSTSIQPPGGNFAGGTLAVLGAPSEDAILLAWADAPPNGSTPARVRLTRLSCAP